MVTLEQVERLREKAGVSFEDAKAALEAARGDMLDALIFLEKQGKVAPPAGNGYYSSQSAPPPEEQAIPHNREKKQTGESFFDMLSRFGRFCAMLLDKGNHNYLQAERKGNIIFSLPVTVIVLMLLFLFWVVIPLFLVSLFFGFRYRFSGRELGKDSVNRVMDSASDAVEGLKKSINNEG